MAVFKVFKYNCRLLQKFIGQEVRLDWQHPNKMLGTCIHQTVCFIYNVHALQLFKEDKFDNILYYFVTMRLQPLPSFLNLYTLCN